MRPLLTTLLAMLLLSSGLYLVAGPSATLPSDLMPTTLPIPRDPPPAPAPPPPPVPPAPVPPNPPVPPKPMEKRCGLGEQHRPHLWTDKAGLMFQCDGGAEFRPPGHDPPQPKF